MNVKRTESEKPLFLVLNIIVDLQLEDENSIIINMCWDCTVSVLTPLCFIRSPSLIQEGPQPSGLSRPHCDRQLRSLWHVLRGPDGKRPQDLQQSWASHSNASRPAASAGSWDHPDIPSACRKDLVPWQPWRAAMETSHPSPAQDGCAERVMGKKQQQARWMVLRMECQYHCLFTIFSSSSFFAWPGRPCYFNLWNIISACTVVAADCFCSFLNSTWNIWQMCSFHSPPRAACSKQCPHSANQEAGLSLQCLQAETQSHTTRSTWYDWIYTLTSCPHTNSYLTSGVLNM